MSGASVVIFMGSMYSMAYEQQILGKHPAPFQLMGARICREGQTKRPRSVIIGDPSWEAEAAAFLIQKARSENEVELVRKLSMYEWEELAPKLTSILLSPSGIILNDFEDYL